MTPEALLVHVQDWLVARDQDGREHAECTAPDFSILDFLDRRENGLSRILAWLLDPRGTHAQGPSFLRAFLHWLSLGDDWLFVAPAARVAIEVPASSAAGAGFIDILIWAGGRALAIENKPTAADQPLQVERYLDVLARDYRAGHHLLYLSGAGNGPSTMSIGKERDARERESGVLLVHGYAALIEWLEACLAISRAPTVTAVIEGMRRYINKEFMGMSDVSEATSLAERICESSELLAPALATIEAASEVRKRILQRLVGQICDECRRRSGWHVVRHDIGSEAHTGLLIGFSPNSNIGFGIEFELPGHGWLFYGMAVKDGLPISADLKACIEQILGPQNSSPHWPVWKTVGPNDCHFPLPQAAHREFWLTANDGTLSCKIIEFVRKVEAHLQAAGMLQAVGALRSSSGGKEISEVSGEMQ